MEHVGFTILTKNIVKICIYYSRDITYKFSNTTFGVKLIINIKLRRKREQTDVNFDIKESLLNREQSFQEFFQF